MTKNQKSLIQSDTSFFLNKDTKTCTISRLIKGIQLLACDLDTEFEILCTIYYLLYGSEIFSDYLFLQEVTVLLIKFKKIIDKCCKIDPYYLNLFYIETGSVKLSDIFSFAEWTKRVLSGFVCHVYIKLISYSEFNVCY